MGNNGKAKTDIIVEAIRRFPNLPIRSISRYILDTNGVLWDNNLEVIRSKVRYHLGRDGETNRTKARDKSCFRPEAIKIEQPKTWRITRTEYKMPVGKWLVLADLHVPYHEPMAVEAAVEYGKRQGVTGVFINGDFQDCAAIGIWFTRKRDWMAEVEATIDMLDWLRSQFPDAKMVYKPGNHEYRLPRYYISNAPELIESPVTAMESHLDFEGRDIDFLDYNQVAKFGLLPVIHGHEVKHIDNAVNPARGLYLKAKSYALCAHCHRTSMHTERDINGKIMTTFSIGCLCDLSPDYTPLANNWNWGGAIITTEKNGDFIVDNFRILPSGEVV